MILIIDNYDSFTYNLVQAVGKRVTVKVIKNDEMSLSQIDKLNPNGIILSPGPGRPENAGICEALIKEFKGKYPILGVCLGHQAICECFGATITYAKTLLHGKSSAIHIANGSPIFKGLPPIIEGARYHSLIAEKTTLSDDTLIIAEDDCGEVMGVKIRDYEIYGLQFHPESILTFMGETIIENFIDLAGAR